MSNEDRLVKVNERYGGDTFYDSEKDEYFVDRYRTDVYLDPLTHKEIEKKIPIGRVTLAELDKLVKTAKVRIVFMRRNVDPMTLQNIFAFFWKYAYVSLPKEPKHHYLKFAPNGYLVFNDVKTGFSTPIELDVENSLSYALRFGKLNRIIDQKELINVFKELDTYPTLYEEIGPNIYQEIGSFNKRKGTLESFVKRITVT